MKIVVIASDHAGFVLKEKLRPYLEKKGFQINDLGTYSEENCDYPKFAGQAAKYISDNKYKRGILICKSGIGSSIVANRFPGVRAAPCYNAKAAQLSREHNDSNILVLGAAFVNIRMAQKILDVWLNTEFQGGRHRRRLNQIKKIERGIK